VRLITVWGRPDSTNVRKVIWCLHELNLPFEHILAGGQYGLTTSSEYLSMNPNGLVPCLKDNDFLLWESNTILRFLVEKYGKESIYLSDIESRYSAERWMDWCLSTLVPNFRIIMLQIKLPKDQQNANTLSKAILLFEQKLELLNEYLKYNKMIAGENFSVADIALGSYFHSWNKVKVKKNNDFPAIERWYAALISRDAFKNTIPA